MMDYYVVIKIREICLYDFSNIKDLLVYKNIWLLNSRLYFMRIV